MSASYSLPIDDVVSQIIDALRLSGRAVIAAPPGAGKSTGIPPRVIEAFPGSSSRLLLLQPRRMAARAVAARLATVLDCQLGKEVGYQVRMDRRWNRDSRIVVMTYGVLLRRLLSDPCLEPFDTVLLDEFHERSLEADLALGMLSRLRQALREDLRVGVMSATLDAGPLADYLDSAPVIESRGRMFPVDVRYLDRRGRTDSVSDLVDVLPEAFAATSGNLLAFLPGVGEIRRVASELRDARWLGDAEVLELYGDLSPTAQDRVLRPSRKRKLVLSTNVAETSVTVEGVTCVVDSGVARVMRTDPSVGIARLEVEPISKASADQRAGRAGRTAPGICFRLWNQASQRARPDFDTPEILRGDLASTVLQLYGWGETDLNQFPWLTAPRSDAVETAERLLQRLGAIHDQRITPLGEQMLALPVHPRLARLVLEGTRCGIRRRAIVCAALIAERDPMIDAVGRQKSQAEVRAHDLQAANLVDRARRLDAWLAGAEDSAVHRGAAEPLRQLVRQLENDTDARYESATPAAEKPEATAEPNGTDGPNDTDGPNGTDGPGDSDEPEPTDAEDREDGLLARCLLTAFPDRLAKRRHPGSDRGLMVGQTGVRVKDSSMRADAAWFVCIEMLAKSRDAHVRRAIAVDEAWLQGPNVSEAIEYFFHPSQKRVVARHRVYWLDLIVKETPCEITDAQQASDILRQHVVEHWSTAFPNNDSNVAQWIARINYLVEHDPRFADQRLDTSSLQSLALQLCDGRVSMDQLRDAPWIDAFHASLGYDRVALVQRLAPERLQLPSGNHVAIDYTEGSAPTISVRLQELFGWTSTPRIIDGRQALLLRILAPNHREVQVTQDLENFWRTTYDQVRKELRRRYPKHHWPEKPLEAVATRSGLGRHAPKS